MSGQSRKNPRADAHSGTHGNTKNIFYPYHLFCGVKNLAINLSDLMLTTNQLKMIYTMFYYWFSFKILHILK